jgi:glycosyltransferase involved in cell wall biosynthesis
MLAEDLQKLGCEVLIAAASKDEQEHFYQYNEVEVYRYPVTTNPTLEEVRGEISPLYFEHFTHWIDQQQPDIVHQHSYTGGCGFYHAQYIKDKKIPLVFTVHVPEVSCPRGTLMRWGNIPCDGAYISSRCTACVLEKNGIPKPFATILSHVPSQITAVLKEMNSPYSTALRMKKILEHRQNLLLATFTMADHVVAVAHWLGKILEENQVNQEKLSVSRHGLNSETLHNNAKTSRTPASPLRIGYIGRFNWVKGIHVLLEAAEKVVEKNKFELHIYGRANGAEEQQYLQYIQDKAVHSENVFFKGEVNSENRVRILSSIDILAVPSVGFETGPLVVLEAFAAGIPVIGSNLGGIAETVTDGQNGILVPAGDSDAWAMAISTLIRNLNWIVELQQKIPKVKSSNDVAKEMLDIYQNLIAT